MTDEDDPDAAAAAEYVLGTLPAEERDAFARRLDRDPRLREAVLAWEERLAPLAARIPPVEPPERVWRAVEAGTQAGPAGGEVVSFSAEVARLRRSRTVWQGATAAAAALAAALALWIAVDVRAPAAPRSLVAVVNRAGDLPALLVRVDPREGVVRIRALAAETPAGRSLELWSIVGGEAPRSLGTLGPGGRRAAIPEADRSRLENATLAVSVEPPGGSPTGQPTGEVVYSGKLVPDPE